MKIRSIILILATSIVVSCNYTTTSFFIDNQTSKEINFDATAIIFHRQMLTKQTFQLSSDNKVLLRNVQLSSKGDITNLFTEINFLNITVDSLRSPMNPETWIESIDAKGNRIFTYTIK